MKKELLFLLITIAILFCAAFAEGAEWEYSPNQGGVGAYNGAGGDISVPEVVEDHAVRALGDSLFYRNAGVTGLFVPPSVLSLGNSSINSCDNLKTVTLSEGLQSIEYNNFFSLPELSELTIPSTVMFIDYSVSWCEQLKTVTFLGECPVFCNPDFCFSVLPDDLTVYVPDDQLEAYRAALVNLKPEQVQPSGRNAVTHDYTPAREELKFDAANGAVTGYTGDSLRVDLPSEIDGVPVKSIEASAFRNSRLAVVNIPEGVEQIGSMAFDGSIDLQAVRLPDSLKKIGSHAFDGIEGNMISWGQGLEEIGEGAFRYVRIGAELALPDSLRVIGNEAFCRASLRNVHIGSGIQKIGRDAFADTNLNYLELDVYDMIEVGEGAFANTRLEDIDLPWDSGLENQRAWQALIDSQAEGCKVWINNPIDCETPARGTDTYAENADGTLYLSAYTGEQPALVIWHTWDGVQITGIGDAVFKGNQTLKKYRVTHSDQFTAIGAEAFAGSAVETVDLYYTTETIGDYAFRDCLGLTEITLPASLKSVGSGAFSGCVNLKYVTILCDPAIIPEDAFAGTAYGAAPASEISQPEPEAPAAVSSADEEDTFVPAREEQYMPMVGTWYGVWIDAGGGQFNPIKDKGYEMILTIYPDGTAMLSDDDRDPQLQSYNGYVMFGAQPLELLEDGLFLHLGSTGSGSMYLSRDRGAEVPEKYRHAMQDMIDEMLATPAPQPTAQHGTSSDGPGELLMDVQYLAVSYSASGFTVDASALPEYAVTLHPDGQCDFVMGGYAMPGVVWQDNGDGTLTIDYMGAMTYIAVLNDGTLDIDMNGMIMHYEARQ